MITHFAVLLITYLVVNGAAGSNRTVRQTPCGKMFECSSGTCVEYSDVCNGLAQCPREDDEDPAVCECGIKTLLTRTTNAPGVRDAHLGSHPWHVGIYRKRVDHPYVLLCSGALIYTDIVITAANCLFNPDSQLTYPSSGLTIAIGKVTRDFSVHESNQQNFEVSEIVIRDNYEGFYKNYLKNVALIKLKRPIQKSFYVKPVCLWTQRKLPSGTLSGSVVGWGLQFSGNYAISLREANVGIIDVQSCIRKHVDSIYRKYITADKFCLSYDQGVGVRDEDNGGPVTFYHEGRYFLYGILSKQFGTEFGLASLTYRHLLWIRNTTYHLKQTDVCLQSSHFNCVSDGACIPVKKLCDGIMDCQDGSDEDSRDCAISHGVSRPTGSSGMSCIIPRRVDLFNPLVCGIKNGCTDPESAPSNSRYQITCPDGFGFAKPKTKSVPIACINGEWVPQLEENRCYKLCEMKNDKSLEVTCTYLGETVKCYELLKPRTQIQIDCKRQYKIKKTVNFVKNTYCRVDGLVNNELSSCEPVCGKTFDNGPVQELISKGVNLTYAKYPWHVAMYKKEERNGEFIYEYKCGGSLIDSNKVLTAAHCVWIPQISQQEDASKIFVIVGKLHSSWLVKDNGEERMEVDKIIVRKHFDGTKTRYSHDIALLILKRDVQLSASRMPVCLDVDGVAGGIPQDQQGHVMGWGKVDPESGPSPVLKEADMDYLDLNNCKKRFDKKYSFNEYLQPDKFCGLYVDGAGTQSGDSGGGMTFTHEGLHYVYGVVSIKHLYQNEFAIFTNVLTHMPWIKSNMNTVPINQV